MGNDRLLDLWTAWPRAWGIGVRPGKSPVGSRWYCRHQHAFSRYFRLGTLLNWNNGQRPGALAPSLCLPPGGTGDGYSLLQLGGGAGGLEVLLELLGLFLRHAFLDFLWRCFAPVLGCP